MPSTAFRFLMAIVVATLAVFAYASYPAALALGALLLGAVVPVERKLLTTGEAAEFLGLSARTLSQWRWLGGRGPRFRKFGAVVKYHVSDLEAYIADSARDSTSDQGGSERTA